MTTEYKKFRTRSGLNFVMSEHLFEEVVNNDPNGYTLDLFERAVMAREFFPQINRYIATIVVLFMGYTDVLPIFLANLITGVLSAVIWNYSSLFKVKALSSIYCLLGQTVFRLCIHILIMAALAFFAFHDWKILLYAVLAGILAGLVEARLCGYRQTAEQNNSMAMFAIKNYWGQKQ